MKVRSIENLSDRFLDEAIPAHSRWLQRHLVGPSHDERGKAVMRRGTLLIQEASRRITKWYLAEIKAKRN